MKCRDAAGLVAVILILLGASAVMAIVIGTFDPVMLVSEAPLDAHAERTFNEAIKQLKDELYSKKVLNLNDKTAEVVAYRKQVTAGMNYLFKVKIDDDSYIHLLAWLNPNQDVVLSQYAMGKGADDPLDPLRAQPLCLEHECGRSLGGRQAAD